MINLKDIGFNIAFGVNDYKIGTVLDNRDFVQWVVQLNIYKNQKSIQKIPVPFHKCTDEDYDNFYPPATGSIESMNAIRTQNFSLYCIDDNFKGL